MGNDYRFDVRTKTEFKKDIKTSHFAEAQIALRLCIYTYNTIGKWPTLVPAGVDNTGEFIEKTSNVNKNADFIINDKYTEITRANTICKKYFHEKKTKVEYALKNKYYMVFVNGFLAEQTPKFIILTPSQLNKATELAQKTHGIVPFIGGGKVGAINKDAYRYDISLFDKMWLDLPVLTKDLPKEYDNILRIANGQI
jgi:hypothetical protein